MVTTTMMGRQRQHSYILLLIVVSSLAYVPSLTHGLVVRSNQQQPQHLVVRTTTANANSISSSKRKSSHQIQRRKTTHLFNFFKDAFSKAFENDRNLSSDKTKQQYDAPGEEYDDLTATNVRTLTETQKLWREKIAAASGGSSISASAGGSINGGGSRVNDAMVIDTRWVLDLYLAGVPERDPSNDLYGSRVNISNRDKATGLSLPSSPSTSVTIQFLDGGVCRADESTFTGSGTIDGQWKLSDDGKILRFSIDQVGYQRTVETRGSIQNVAWTNEEERTTQTSTTYTIPPGFIYGDVPVTPAKGRPGIAGSSFNIAGDGVLRLEKESGLFGISSRMVACGKFEAKRIQAESE
jgi:hypothetical protein